MKIDLSIQLELDSIKKLQIILKCLYFNNEK